MPTFIHGCGRPAGAPCAAADCPQDADRDLNIFLIQPMSSLDSSAGLSVVEQPNTYRMTVFALDFDALCCCKVLYD